jgi:hypothetical protein
MTAYDDLTDSSPESSDQQGFEDGATEQLAQQTGSMAQTPSAIDSSATADDPDSGGSDDVLGGSEDGGGREDDPVGDGAGVDGSDAERGNLDGSSAHEEARDRSLSESQQSAEYTDVGEAGADNGSME